MLILFRANITVFVDYTHNTNLAPPNLGLMVIQLRQACNKILEALDEHKRLSTRLESLGPDDESNSTNYQVLQLLYLYLVWHDMLLAHFAFCIFVLVLGCVDDYSDG